MGGGVIGCSVAYHLAAMGERDVVLLERDRLTSGTTWHAAGLIVTFGSMSQTSTRLRQYTKDLYSRLETETGQSTGLAKVGFIEVAADADRLTEFRRVAAFNRHCGVDVHEISPGQVGELFPLARTDDVRAGFHVPDDGRANPVDVTMALARGARARGVRIVEGASVSSVDVERAGAGGARVRGVHAVLDGEARRIECEVVVNCAGIWARQLGEVNGVALPLQAAEHYYLITEAIDGVHPGLPVLEDPSTYGYIREETGGLLIGLFEGRAAPWSVSAVPQDFSFGSIPPDWDRIASYVEAAISRVPATSDAGLRSVFCGPESFTPDLAPLIGEVPEVRNYFVAAGMNSVGILTGGGIGRVLAQWIVAGEPDLDISAMDVARLQPFQATPSYRRMRTAETLPQVYACHYPDRSPASARGVRRSPVHDRLVAAGAVFRDLAGWEVANHYDPEDVTGDLAEARMTFARPDWFGPWAAEHCAAVDAVALFDLSHLTTFEIAGPDADTVRSHVAGWAGIRMGASEGSRCWVSVTTATARRIESRLRRALASGPLAGARAQVSDVTADRALFAVRGPRSADLMDRLASTGLVTAGLATAGPVTADRDLLVPARHAPEVHDQIVSAGRDLGLRHAGWKALGSLRLERLRRGEPGSVPEGTVAVLLDDPEPMMHGGEVVHRDGIDVGYVTSASYGHTLGGALGLVTPSHTGDTTEAWAATGTWTVDVAGSEYAATASVCRVGSGPSYAG